MDATAGLVLGVDLDGVCGDYSGALRRSVAARRGVDPASLPEQRSFGVFEEWGLDAATYREAHRAAVVEDRIFRTMPALPGVADALWRLSDAGIWIRIITHRLLFNWAHEITAADTAAWLDLQRIPYRDLCFVGDKPTVGADLYVDDSPRNVLALREAGRRVIVFDQPYNRDLGGPRATDWDQLAGMVLEEHQRRTLQAALPLDAAARAIGRG
jgi:5'-nucleotidase